jgi:hypothetical protein
MIYCVVASSKILRFLNCEKKICKRLLFFLIKSSESKYNEGFVNGLMVGIIDNDTFDVMVAHEDGEKVFISRSGDGIVYMNAAGKTAYIDVGSNGLPERVVDNGYIFEFANYTADSVDIAVIFPNGSIEVVRDVEICSDLISMAGVVHIAGVMTTADVREVLAFTKLMVGAAGCGIGIAAASLATAPVGFVGGLAVAAACGGVMLSIIAPMTENTIDDGVDVVLGYITFSSYLDFAFIAADFALNTIDEINSKDTEINLARSALIYGDGDVQITLTWDNSADLDLYVTDPDGTEIYFGNKTSPSGGQLDIDDRDGYGPENIFWESGDAPSGNYLVEVEHYGGNSPANYKILVQLDGLSQTFEGSISSDETKQIYSFTR